MHRLTYSGILLLSLTLLACGPSGGSGGGEDFNVAATDIALCNPDPQVLLTDVNNCGTCNHKCQGSTAMGAWVCIGGKCTNDCASLKAGITPPDLSVLVDASRLLDADVPDAALPADAAPLADGAVVDLNAGAPDLLMPMGPKSWNFCESEQTCVDFNNDRNHCGNCDGVCNDEQNCYNGVCTLDCGQKHALLCNQQCVDVVIDPKNCGNCNVVCKFGELCSMGVCKQNCEGGLQQCLGICVSLPFDSGNCGACSIKCKKDDVCSNGTCLGLCQPGLIQCPGTTNCYNTLTDPAHCGSCQSVCGFGEVCSLGRCQTSCDPGLTRCFQSCVDLTTDVSHCGACDSFCPVGITPFCSQGKCTTGCAANEIVCNGKCTNPSADTSACGNTCPNGKLLGQRSVCGKNQVCSNGGCLDVTSCPQTAQCKDCSCIQKSMTCIDFGADPNNCLDCGVICSSNHISMPTCSVKAKLGCDGQCDQGYGDCDQDKRKNGCETLLVGADINNCGACGRVCSSNNLKAGTNMCSVITLLDGGVADGGAGDGGGGGAMTSSICSGSCQDGFQDCNRDLQSDGCETNLNSLATCGACGQVCAPAHATAACVAQVCKIQPCDQGYGDCNAMVGDGCEASLVSDDLNCGKCATVCSSQNGKGVCAASKCSVACNMFFGNCDGDPGNGCEVSLNNDPNHCGTCATGCTSVNGVATCSFGHCGINCNAGRGNCNGDLTDGCEADLLSEVMNCSACKNVCVTPNADPSCISGVCKVGLCNPGWTDCDKIVLNGCEVHTDFDSNNCGICGAKCSSINGTATCAAGKCNVTCKPGFGDCDGDASNGCEADLNLSTANCGACGQSCKTLNDVPTCNAGVCVIQSCFSGYTDCNKLPADGCETHTEVDAKNCGGCSVVCSNVNGAPSCLNSTCQITCNNNYGDCDGVVSNGCEAFLVNDVNHCGSCPKACALANATANCANSQCGIAACAGGYKDCNMLPTDGCEANVAVDPNNCGACGNNCSNAGGSPSCVSSVCQIQCSAGFGDCNLKANDGCEVNLNISLTNCGGCGKVCSPANATGVCTAGNCLVNQCNPGFVDCNKVAADGCEINTNNNVSNCGACGQACSTANDTPSCSNGACSIVCKAGFGDCDMNVANGCEISLTSDASNCFACGAACSKAGGTASCVNSVCQIQCGAGFGDCNGNANDGCEVNINTDNANCGACAKACTPANATGVCTAGACLVNTCNPGFFDCNKNATDGCEINTNTNVQNCGSCGLACSSVNDTPSCSNGVCSIVCKAGFGDCDGNIVNGCEANLAADPNNCNGCGTICSKSGGTASCVNSVCQIQCSVGFGDCNGKANDGCEVNTNTDLNNCGGCAKLCSPANGTGTCSSGLCLVNVCNPGFVDCNKNPSDGCEVNTNTNVQNCGACNNACSSVNDTPSCSNGACSIVCTAGFGNCDQNIANGCESDLTKDVSHCGSCALACSNAGGTASCSASICGIQCSAGFGDCNGKANDGCEVNLYADLMNCGGCGSVCAPKNATQACTNGACTITACVNGYTDCNHNVADGCEANLQGNDILNCGACGKACSTSGGTAACGAGVCSIVCAANFGDCDMSVTNGCEASLAADVANCGACNKKCSAAGGTPSCVSGQCKIACAAGFTDCNLNVADGCEVNTGGDVTNCGACGTKCTTANATPACSNGVCKVGTCNNGFFDCNSNAADGCEINLTNNVSNCGACGTVCSSVNGTPSCTNGVCAIACSANFGNCNGVASDGCEVNLTNSIPNCGGCGMACQLTNAVQQCLNSTCGIAACTAGFGNCDGITANGCEVDLTIAPTHCGSCATVCNLANATSSCNGGVCKVGQCNAGFLDCNGNAADGCEINTSNNVSNCNGCGTACSANNGAPTCAAGVCSIACNAGFGDCNKSVVDGCEVNTTTSALNCGACGMACSPPNAVGGCVASSCTIASCNAGYTDCNGQVPDGCEKNTAFDAANCGGCGKVCSINHCTSSCASSSCLLACTGGFGNCDGLVSNGCETTFASDVSNCGFCANVCVLANATPQCAAGACAVATCNSGYFDCDGKAPNGCEVNLNSDTSHCGACSTVCSTVNATSQCTAGACKLTCNTNFFDCDNSVATGCEVNLGTDPLNCNACGNACSTVQNTPTCAARVCKLGACNAGFGDCDNLAANGCETNTQTGLNNCGSCGTSCSTNHITATCGGGVCNGTCAAGFADCNGNKQTDGCETDLSLVANCGSCGNVCSPSHITATCTGGACTGACAAGFADCNGNKQLDGCELPITADAMNCGGCATVCSSNHIPTPTCSASTCNGSCAAGFADCNANKQTDGCETDLSLVATCGGCGLVCSTNHVTAACNGTTCNGACAGGFADCNNNKQTDGCEVPTNADVQNCGGCGTVCSTSHITAACSGGACTGTCAAGFADCNVNKQTDGCEIDITLVANCGSCGTVCSPNHITATCTAGNCTGTCAAGFADCNANKQLDGCELPVSADVMNCGGCGTTCSTNHITASCSAGVCNGTCAAGWANCNNTKQANGCDVDITLVANCGGCGLACSTSHVTATCTAGVCAGACAAGFADCNGNKQTDGCETPTNGDVLNCGGCGTVCSSQGITRSCSAGSCNAGVCQAGFADCNGNKQTDGCETPTDANVTNCGGCGVVCPGTNMSVNTCTGGTCTGTCNAGFGDCDNNKLTNGCESNLQTDSNHCGACSGGQSTCANGKYCSSGSCVTCSTNCAGCCSTNTCQPGTAVGACGLMGAACVDCGIKTCNISGVCI